MKRNAFHILVFLLAVAGLSSCKEDDNTVEEYPDWQAKNEAYFNNLYKEADTALVHYQGRLLPSTTFPKGRIFDQSWTTTEFNPSTNAPRKFAISSVVDGFATALQNMKAGDRWLIYIPYQLGYGPKGNNGIPAYSTLVFDVTLAGSYHPKTTTKENKKKN